MKDGNGQPAEIWEEAGVCQHPLGDARKDTAETESIKAGPFLGEPALASQTGQSDATPTPSDENKI